MGRKSQIQIRETLEELTAFRRKCKSVKEEKRVLALIHLKENEDITQAEVAESLGVTDRTMRAWLRQYKELGLSGCLPRRTRAKKSKLISREIHEALEVRLSDTSNPLLGYWHAKEWLLEEHCVSLNYHWLRKYMIEKLAAKLKQPRKSHIKKDKEAQRQFFANSKMSSTRLD